MELKLPYGLASSLTLDVPADNLLADWSSAGDLSLPDLSHAVQQALAAPRGYPSLAQAIVPGDRVTIVPDEDVPQAAEISAAVIASLLEGGLEPEAITVLHTGASDGAILALDALLPTQVSERVQRVRHDGGDRDQLSFLGTASSGAPIYVNRALADADLIIPISCVAAGDSNESRGEFGLLYPAFADSAALGENTISAAENAPTHREMAEQVGWLLGIRLLVKVVPAAVGIAELIVGDLDTVGPQARRVCEAAWSFTAPRRARLAIVSLGGAQSWQNAVQALAAAEKIVDPSGGAVLLCTELDELPDSLQCYLADNEFGAYDDEAAEDTDSVSQWQVISRALERCSLFLLSRIDDDLIEDLGMAPVHDEHEIERLVSQFESCIVLANGQFASVRVADEDVLELPGG
ncbi:MAG: DUF2088 domain-containing protein [Planctomycetales bacterium]|nr:DUF2088 domain-containing protein [Planctomycetales bacterium]